MGDQTEKFKIWVIIVLCALLFFAIGGPIGGVFGFLAVLIWGYLRDRDKIKGK